MDDNARPHRVRVVTDYLLDELITARSPDLNLIGCDEKSNLTYKQ
jgi:hypothetical protein